MKRKADPDRGMTSVFDIIPSFLQSFSITQSFILFHFPRTLTCRQLMEVQHTAVKSTGSWARQASSSSSKTILLKTLKIEKKNNPEKFGDFLLPFCDQSHWSSLVWQSRLIRLVDSVELGLLCLWAIPTDLFSLESGCSYSNIMTAGSKVGVFSSYARGS